MSEARVGRLLVASLHQAIADILPMRLEFYESWLSVSGLRDGTIGLAPLFAVLSFLRAEGTPYDTVMTRAGEYAGEWTVKGLPGIERRLIRALPTRFAHAGCAADGAFDDPGDVSGHARNHQAPARQRVGRSSRIAVL